MSTLISIKMLHDTDTMDRTESLSLMECRHLFQLRTAEWTYKLPDCEPSHMVGSTEDILSTAAPTTPSVQLELLGFSTLPRYSLESYGRFTLTTTRV